MAAAPHTRSVPDRRNGSRMASKRARPAMARTSLPIPSSRGRCSNAGQPVGVGVEATSHASRADVWSGRTREARPLTAVSRRRERIGGPPNSDVGDGGRRSRSSARYSSSVSARRSHATTPSGAPSPAAPVKSTPDWTPTQNWGWARQDLGLTEKVEFEYRCSSTGSLRLPEGFLSFLCS